MDIDGFMSSDLPRHTFLPRSSDVRCRQVWCRNGAGKMMTATTRATKTTTRTTRTICCRYAAVPLQARGSYGAGTAQVRCRYRLSRCPSVFPRNNDGECRATEGFLVVPSGTQQRQITFPRLLTAVPGDAAESGPLLGPHEFPVSQRISVCARSSGPTEGRLLGAAPLLRGSCQWGARLSASATSSRWRPACRRYLCRKRRRPARKDLPTWPAQHYTALLYDIVQ